MEMVILSIVILILLLWLITMICKYNDLIDEVRRIGSQLENINKDIDILLNRDEEDYE